MARFRRFRNAYANRAAYYSRAKGYYGRAQGINNKFLGINSMFLIGAAGGWFLPHNQLIDNAAVLAAVAPIKGLGPVKKAAQGYVFTHAAKSLISGGIGNMPNTLQGTTVI